MKSKTMLVIIWGIWLPVVGLGQAPSQQFPREVTITAIPGVIAAGAKWQQVWQGTDNADGIVATPDGGLLFAQEQANTIRKLDKNDYDSAYVKDTHGTGSVAIDSQGRLVAAQRTCTDPGRANLPCTEPTKIAIIYPEKDKKVLADNFQGKPFGRLSEAIVGKNGNVYFIAGGAYYIKPGGQAMSIGENPRASGLMISPDEKTLYVGNGGGVLAFEIQADGTVGNQREFAKMPAGANGNSMAVDAAGRLYVASGATGVQVFGADGKHLGIIPTPRNVVTVTFSGPDKKTLYMVGSGALAPNGKEFALAEGFRNNAKTIYKIPMLAQGYQGRAK
jgi:gluconolactonase